MLEGLKISACSSYTLEVVCDCPIKEFSKLIAKLWEKIMDEPEVRIRDRGEFIEVYPVVPISEKSTTALCIKQADSGRYIITSPNKFREEEYLSLIRKSLEEQIS